MAYTFYILIQILQLENKYILQIQIRTIFLKQYKCIGYFVDNGEKQTTLFMIDYIFRHLHIWLY